MSRKVTYCLFTTNVRRLANQLFEQLAYAISKDGKRSFSCAISAETSRAPTALSRTKPALSDDVRLRELRRGQSLARSNSVGGRTFCSGDLTGSCSRAFQPDDSGCRGACLQLTRQTLHLSVYNSEGRCIKRCKQTGVLFRCLRGEGPVRGNWGPFAPTDPYAETGAQCHVGITPLGQEFPAYPSPVRCNSTFLRDEPNVWR
ncbi:hypothetical protein K456DRAFT_874165 [Colletotrichum gloeosporioides 23]|nr:hypothetical protein K456DRAFT_874165 [Colletotrichum gloeosporioides 23]